MARARRQALETANADLRKTQKQLRVAKEESRQSAEQASEQVTNTSYDQH